MNTRTVGFFTKAGNYLTKTGRKRTDFSNKLKQGGCSQIRTRKLKNGSEMVMGWKPGKSTSEITYMALENGTSIQGHLCKAINAWKTVNHFG